MTQTIDLDDEFFTVAPLVNFDLEQIIPKDELKFEPIDSIIYDNELLIEYDDSDPDNVKHDLKSLTKIFEN